MALRASPLRSLARRVMGPQAVMPLRGGGGGPIAFSKPVNEPLKEEDELMWHDGSANPEPCLDQFNLVTTGQASLWLAGGLSLFVGLYYTCSWRDKASKIPYRPKEFPFNNLQEEMGNGAPASLLTDLPGDNA